MADPNNPWGNRGKKPNDFDDLIQKGLKAFFGDQKKKGNPFGPDKDEPSSGKGLSIVIFALAIIFLAFQAAYTIQAGEQGVVMRFGQFHKTAQPGLNFLIPFIEKVIKVDVESIQKEEFGAGRERQRVMSNNIGGAGDLESLMLTADLNVIQVSWVVQYKIRDPENFLFNIQDPRAAVRDVSESVIRRLVGNRDFNYVLNEREELGTATRNEMQDVLNKYNSGIQLVVVQLLDVNPPDAVRPSFNEVNEAEQDKIRLSNEAQEIMKQQVPRAKGEAQKKIDEASGYAIERVNKAKGDVARFNAIYKEYRKAKKVTRTRMYVEALKQSLPQVQEIIIIDQSKKGMMPLVNIGAAAASQQVRAKAASANTSPSPTPAQVAQPNRNAPVRSLR